MGSDEIRKSALKYAVYNAVSHEGKAQKGSIMGRILGETPELRSRATEVSTIVDEVLSEVNSWTLEHQKETLEERWPEMYQAIIKGDEKKQGELISEIEEKIRKAEAKDDKADD